MRIRISSLIAGLVVLVAVFLVNSTRAVSSVPQQSSPIHASSSIIAQDTTPYTTEIEEGLEYFRQLAEAQLVLVEELQVALESGDLAMAEAAYVEARPPYEQIEVFAASFEQEDSDIDARPYAFDDGEQSAEFKGFHRIERLVFRDRDLAAAIPYAEELQGTVQSLLDKLNDPSNFSASLNFDGMIGLATEVPARKISGEEETWSDQSILIFRENWDGIYSQYLPFASSLDAAIAAEVDAAYEACQESIAPFVTAGVAAAAPYSSLNVDQRRAILQASYQLRDALIDAREALNIG